MTDIRTALADYLNDQAAWRQGKADEYPEDPRNQRSAKALRQLAQYVLSLPSGDERLRMLAALDWVAWGRFVPGAEAGRVVARIGFDLGPSDIDALLTRFTDACVDDATKNTGAPAPWDVE